MTWHTEQEALRGFDLHLGDLVTQTYFTEYYPKWFRDEPRLYLFSRILEGNLLYLGPKYVLLDSGAKSYGWVPCFLHINTNQKFWILGYPSYMRGRTFKELDPEKKSAKPKE